MAAGQGTRMRSAVPKVLHEVCGRPMIAWPVIAAREAGAGRICVIVSPGGELDSALPDGTETIVQPEADGTGGALRAATDVVRDSDTVLVLSGDTPLLGAAAIEELRAAHREAGAAATTMTT
jgi:bifunctional UDP-N-acetylglucosamine pyrophosphorylase/glucosamine-1-phosphate N-acetyltransferase